MNIPEQNKYIQFVNLLNCQKFFSEVTSVIVSPLVNSLLVLTRQKNALLYLLPYNEHNTKPFWQCSSKVQG